MSLETSTMVDSTPSSVSRLLGSQKIALDWINSLPLSMSNPSSRPIFTIFTIQYLQSL